MESETALFETIKPFLPPMLAESPLLTAAVIVVLGYVLGKIVKLLVRHASRLADITKSEIDDLIVEEVGRAIMHAVYVSSIMLAILVLYSPEWLITAYKIILILIAARALINIALFFIDEYIHKFPLEKDQIEVIVSAKGMLRAVAYAVVVMMLLSAVGIDILPIITSLGIGGLALSMAMKDIVTDYVSGIITIMGREIRRGQRILVKDKGVEGEVVDIGWRHTILRTDNGETIAVPNRVVSASTIIIKSSPEEKEGSS